MHSGWLSWISKPRDQGSVAIRNTTIHGICRRGFTDHAVSDSSISGTAMAQCAPYEAVNSNIILGC